MKTFVIHYTKLKDRKEFILNQFEDENITDYEFIEGYDQEVLTFQDKSYFANLKLSGMSVILKHLQVWRTIAASTEYDMALVLEDDVILDKDFTSVLSKYLEQLPPTFDMLNIGNGSNMHIEDDKIVPGKYIYLKGLEQTCWGGFGATRACDSYILSKKGAQKICSYFDSLTRQITIPIDHWLNYVLRDVNAEVYWAEPTIVIPGSMIGIFQSTL
jgi:GR25 family glycosyltransferase involved in LPS biosynthesis